MRYLCSTKRPDSRQPFKINGLEVTFVQSVAFFSHKNRIYRSPAKRGLQVSENTWKIKPAVREDLAV